MPIRSADIEDTLTALDALMDYGLRTPIQWLMEDLLRRCYLQGVDSDAATSRSPLSIERLRNFFYEIQENLLLLRWQDARRLLARLRDEVHRRGMESQLPVEVVPDGTLLSR